MKKSIRLEIMSQRSKLKHREQRSLEISQRCLDQTVVLQSKTILAYVGVRTEVQTTAFISTLLGLGKSVAVPYCQDGQLIPFQLESLNDLTPGMYGIPEPKTDLRQIAGRRVSVDRIETFIVPGVAFDRCGRRLGHGKGYYDRLLQWGSNDAVKIGLAFECQLVPEIPIEHHDIPMDYLVTETAVYNTANNLE